MTNNVRSHLLLNLIRWLWLQRKRRKQRRYLRLGRRTRMSYVDPKAPGSFGGIQNVRRYGGKVKDLSRNDAYTLHKPTRIRFPRGRTFFQGIADLFQINLVVLSNLSTYNDGYRYLLNCLDVFTKRAFAVPTSASRGEPSVWEYIDKRLQTQHGTERQRHGVFKFRVPVDDKTVRY